ncbi:carboxylesterase [Sulfuricaulis limicola]|uniref:Carboxylesterase n=1 Tax=Sulfuricaulis limicola TaxID=1620215 RepID=A0A1B4XF10_9GAMM|nr:alpha/beta hydrolase [Sulfuricaulis limicola]BAV33379.1 carboxylesterase [Sulfuricaulis limicola]
MDIQPREEPAVEVETGANPAASIIWLHGLGADGHDFEPIIPELRLPATPALRFVFPHAPYRPVTINNGYVMRAWYDIAMSERGLEQNADHIRESGKILETLIDRETRRGIACKRIVLAGFSQGGAIVLHAGLRYPGTLAGIMVLSAPIPYAENLMAEIHPANATVPVFIAHGTDDRVVPLDLVQQTHRRMEARGLRLERHTYKMGHTLAPDEIRDIVAWLARVLAGQGG